MPIMKLATTQTSMDCVPVAKLVVDSMENAYSAKSREVNGECRNHFFVWLGGSGNRAPSLGRRVARGFHPHCAD